MRGAVTFAGAVGCFFPVAGHAAVRSSTDQFEVDRIRAKSPHAALLLEQGEALAAAGHVAEAEPLFRQAFAEDADGSILARRDCQALTVLGRRAEAIRQCVLAVEGRQTNANFRAIVRALVAGPVPPTASELGQALALTTKERDRGAKGNPAPVAALCDIAESVGDGIMLQHCAEKLEQWAPNDPDTRRAEALLNSRCPPWWLWTGWLSLLALCVVTVVHALRRVGLRSSAAAAMGITVFCAMAAVAKPAWADPNNNAESGYLSRWSVDNDAPETKIPSDKDRDADPLEFGYWLQDLALKAERASKRGDHDRAARFYMALAKAVPDRAVGFTHACSEYEAMKAYDLAVNACGAALLRDGLMLQDYLHYVSLMVAKPGALTPVDLKALDNVIAHMREDPVGKTAADDVECAVATKTANAAQLEECTKNLAQSAPNDVRTVSYEWTLAMQKGKFDEAQVLIERASALGLSPEAAAKMQQSTLDGLAARKRRILLGALAGALLLAGMGGAGWSFFSRRRATPVPNPA